MKATIAAVPPVAVAHEVDRATAVVRVASTSFVGVLPAGERAEVLRRAEALLDTHPATRGRPTLRLPYRADVYWCTRRPAADDRGGH